MQRGTSAARTLRELLAQVRRVRAIRGDQGGATIVEMGFVAPVFGLFLSRTPVRTPVGEDRPVR